MKPFYIGLRARQTIDKDKSINDYFEIKECTKLESCYMNAAQAKQIRLYDLLAHLNCQVENVKHGGDDVWYKSPFRKEETASFHISLSRNCWFDFGEGKDGKGRSIIDFVVKLKSTDVRGALDFLESTGLRPSESSLVLTPANQRSLFDPKVGTSKIEIIKAIPIDHPGLKDYLVNKRGISLEIGLKYFMEVHYKFLEGRFKDKAEPFFALGLPNNSGGWALNNQYFITATSPNDITFVDVGSKNTDIYEGGPDFGSNLELKKTLIPSNNALILNSVSLTGAAIELLKKRGDSTIINYTDNDKAGQAAYEHLKEELPGIIDGRSEYSGFKDWNALLLKKKGIDPFSRSR